MKVVLVHNRYRSSAPSGENRVVDQQVDTLHAMGHEVLRFERDSDEIASWSPARKALLPAESISSRSSRRNLASILREFRPDVAHVHNTVPLLSSAVLYACRDAKVPVVATIHNYRLGCVSGDFFRRGATCHDCAGKIPVLGVLRGCYRDSRAASLSAGIAITAHRAAWRSLVSAYIFISEAQRDLLAQLQLPQDRVFVSHNLVPRQGQPSDAREARVLYAGRLNEVKGLRLLMDAWDRYCARSVNPGLRLTIAGAGPLSAEVDAWAAGRPSIELLGQVSGDECLRLMSRSRAVVVPSAWEEPFGLVVVEAMSMGVPAIATRHGSFVELIRPGVDGELFDPASPSALAEKFSDADLQPELYEAFGEQALKTYEERFDPRASIERLENIYRFAIDNPVTGPARTSNSASA